MHSREPATRLGMTPIRTTSDPDWLAGYVLGRFDAPAFVRRARNVADAYDALLARCASQRGKLLREVRRALAEFNALTGSATVSHVSVLSESETQKLAEIGDAVGICTPIATRCRGRGTMSRALRELARSVERFNTRWAAFLSTVDLGEINRLREGYNRYYLLEKECALRSAALAQIGFNSLPALRREDLTSLFPPLPILNQCVT